MSSLMKVIKMNNRDAARVLEQAGLCTDSDVQSLTREDLHELFPGAEKFKLRRKLFEIINKEKPSNQLITRLKDIIPDNSLRADLVYNGVLVESLKDLKIQINKVLSLIDAQIGFLDQESGKGSLSGSSTSASCGPVVSNNGPSVGHSQGAQESFTLLSPEDAVDIVKYKMLVSGETFGAHHQFMEKVKKGSHDWPWLVEKNDNSQFTILFCVIRSRIGPDIAAAMAEVKDDKPVILVLMHHFHEPKVTTTVRTWAEVINDGNIVLHVSVFYHETACGLVRCKENDDAVLAIQNLLGFCPQRSVGTSRQSRQAAGTESGGTGSRSSTDEGKNEDSVSSGFWKVFNMIKK